MDISLLRKHARQIKMKCTTTATLQLLFFLTSSGSWNTQKAISSLEPSSDVDTVTAMGKSETLVGRRSSDEDDDEDDVSCEWFSGFSVGERDRRSTFADRSRRSCIFSGFAHINFSFLSLFTNTY